MLSITNSVLSSYSVTQGNKLETKSRGTKRDEIPSTSWGSRPDSKRLFNTTPGTQLPVIEGKIPPKDQRIPNVVYIDNSSYTDKSKEAFKVFSAQKKGFLYQQGTANANRSSYQLSCHQESAGSKLLAVGRGSSTGVKALAVHPTSSSSVSKAPAVFSSKFGGKSLL